MPLVFTLIRLIYQCIFNCSFCLSVYIHIGFFFNFFNTFLFFFVLVSIFSHSCICIGCFFFDFLIFSYSCICICFVYVFCFSIITLLFSLKRCQKYKAIKATQATRVMILPLQYFGKVTPVINSLTKITFFHLFKSFYLLKYWNYWQNQNKSR